MKVTIRSDLTTLQRCSSCTSR